MRFIQVLKFHALQGTLSRLSHPIVFVNRKDDNIERPTRGVHQCVKVKFQGTRGAHELQFQDQDDLDHT